MAAMKMNMAVPFLALQSPFLSRGEVFGWPYGELLGYTVRFRARVASLPR